MTISFSLSNILTDFENATTFSVTFFELWKTNIQMLHTKIKRILLASCWYDYIPNRLARNVDNVTLHNQPKYWKSHFANFLWDCFLSMHVLKLTLSQNQCFSIVNFGVKMIRKVCFLIPIGYAKWFYQIKQLIATVNSSRDC